MSGRQHQCGGAVDGVHPRGEHGNVAPVSQRRDSEANLGPFRTSDPVSLEYQHLVGPGGHPLHLVEQFVGVVGDPQEPLRQFPILDDSLASPAASGLDLLVGEHGLAAGAPVDGAVFPVGEPPFPHLQEEPLVPPVVGGIASGELPVPVVAEAESAELPPHVVDVVRGPVGGMGATLKRGVLRRQPERIPADGMHDGEAAAAVEPGHHVPDGVVPHVAHVDAPGGIGQHLEAVVVGPRGQVGSPEGALAFPAGLPFRFDAFVESAHG